MVQIKQQEDKFFSKDPNSQGEASFRVLYYGGASGTVPFMWETCPGTPKHHLFKETSSVPPLTPPPSYLSAPKINNSGSKINRRPKILDSLFFSKSKSSNAGSSISSSSVSSPNSFSIPSTPRNLYARWGTNGHRRSRSAVHFYVNEDKDDDELPPGRLPVCFGGRGAAGKFGMYRPMKNVKKAILFIVGGNGRTN